MPSVAVNQNLWIIFLLFLGGGSRCAQGATTTIYAATGCPSGGGTGDGQPNSPYCDLDLAFAATENIVDVTLSLRGNWNLSHTITTFLNRTAQLMTIIGPATLSCDFVGFVGWNITSLESNTALRVLNVTFSNCDAAIAVQNANSFLAQDITLHNCAYARSALIVSQVNTITILNSRFTSNGVTTVGGALRLEGNRVIISDSIFRDNYSLQSAGAAYIVVSTSLSITRCLFMKNSALNGSAGAIWMLQPVGTASVTIKDSQFMTNNAKDEGGVLHVQAHTIRIEGSLFNESVSVTQQGGVGSISYTSALTITDSVFLKGGAHTQGGSFYITGDGDATSSVSVMGSSFSLGGSDVGAIFYIMGTSSLSITDSSYVSNFANIQGGVLYISTTGVTTSTVAITITASRFVTNGATANGGGVFYYESSSSSSSLHMVLDRVVLWKNRASNGNGGALYIHSNDTNSNVEVRNSILSNNIAPNGLGGGIFYLTDKQGAMFKGYNTTFFQNKGTDGGGLWAANQPVNVNLFNCSFQQNYAVPPIPIGAGVGAKLLLDGGSILNSVIFYNNFPAFPDPVKENYTNYGALSISCANSGLAPRIVSMQNMVNAGLSGVLIYEEDIGMGYLCDNLSISYSILVGNDGPGISLMGAGRVDASHQNSIHQNAPYRGSRDVRCASYPLSGSVILAINNNGSVMAEGCNCTMSPLDICGICGGDGSYCTSPTCTLPYRDCNTNLTSFSAPTGELGLGLGLTSGSPSASFYPTHNNNTEAILPVRLDFPTIRALYPNGSVQAVQDLSDGRWLPGVPLNGIIAITGDPSFVIFYQNVFPPKQIVVIQQALYTSVTEIEAGTVTFLTAGQSLKVSIAVANWPYHTAQLEARVVTQEPIANVTRSNITNNVEGFLLKTVGGNNVTITFPTLFTIKAIVDYDSNATIKGELKQDANEYAYHITFTFPGPFTAFQYDPDFSVVLSGDDNGNGNGNGGGDGGDDMLLLKILLPALVGVALIVLVLIIVAVVVSIAIRARIVRARFGESSARNVTF